MLTSAANVHLTLPDVYVSPVSLRKKPILLNGSSIHSIDFSTSLQKLKAACRLWKSCIRLVLVSTWGRPSREQRNLPPLVVRQQKQSIQSQRGKESIQPLCALLHYSIWSFNLCLTGKSMTQRRVCVNVCIAWSKSQKRISYFLAPFGLLESTVVWQIEAWCSAFTSKTYEHSCSNLKNLKGTVGRYTKLPLITRPGKDCL